MNRGNHPTRFSDQVKRHKPKLAIIAGTVRRSATETATGNFEPPSRRLPDTKRPHYSSPTVPVNQSGKFNYDLQKTGFLGDIKMRTKRIAENPKRFLEAYADGLKTSGSEQEFVPTEVPELEYFLQKLSIESRFEVKEAEMKKRSESAKLRTFLLAMASTSSLELDPKTMEFLHSHDGGEDKVTANGNVSNVSKSTSSYDNAEEMESLVKNYVEQMKVMETTSIEDWVSEFVTLEKLELPHGLPTNIPVHLPHGEGEFGDSDEISEFIESCQDNFILLDGEYHTKVEEITKELRTNYNLLNQEWTNRESSLLFYVLNSFGSGNASLAAVLPLQMELTRRLFPGKSQCEIIKQKFRLRTKKTLEEKRGAVIGAWIHDKDELQLKINIAWQEVSLKRRAEMEKKLCFKKQKDICEFWAERLQKLRQEKCEKIRKLKILAEPLEKYRETRTKSIAESEALRREAVKREVEKYKCMKNEVKVTEIMRKEQEIELKQQLTENKKRVSYRKTQQRVKEKAKQDLEEAMEEQRRLREFQLEQTKEPVDIDYDPANVVAQTHASLVRRFETVKEQKKIEDERMASVFRECYSFSAETVLKDRRTRFQVKLKEAGLLDSAYARQVLMAMEPQPKPHLQSQVKMSHEDDR